MSIPNLDIENNHIRSFEELKLLFDSPEAKIPGSQLYQTLIDLAIDSVLPDFLHNIGKVEMAGKMRALDAQQSDLQIMNELQRIITGGAVDIAFDPLAFVQVLNTSIVKCEHAIQTCFEIQILKAVKEELLFSVESEMGSCDKHLNLENYRRGEVVSVTQELSESVGEVLFLINGKEVSRKCLNYDVTFLCDTTDAVLIVDNNLVASSFPITIELPYGSHAVTVSCPGYVTYGEQLMVRNNHNCSIVLEKRPSSVGDILCTDDTTIPCSEWPVNGKTAKGVVFYVDDSGYHGWAVHLRNQGEWNWSNNDKQQLVPRLSICNISTLALTDMDGYANTEIIRFEAKIYSLGVSFAAALALMGKVASPRVEYLSGFPAAFAVDFKNGWYLPACGQLKLLMDRKDEVNAALKKAEENRIDSGYWSSTPASENEAWFMSLEGNPELRSKIREGKVRAVISF